LTQQTTQRTPSEEYLEEAFRFLEIPYEIFQVFCFRCCSHFSWSISDCPKCFIGKHQLGKGEFARPDFIIRNGNQLGIVFVNGSIHQKKRIHKRDLAQIKEYMRNKIKVFVVENDELDEMSDWSVKRWTRIPWRNVASAQLIWDCMRSDELYKKFLSLKDISSRLYH
jgi:hypothetical protein